MEHKIKGIYTLIKCFPRSCRFQLNFAVCCVLQKDSPLFLRYDSRNMGMKTDSRKIIELLAIGMEGNKKTTCQCAMERRNFCWRPKIYFLWFADVIPTSLGFQIDLLESSMVEKNEKKGRNRRNSPSWKQRWYYHLEFPPCQSGKQL